jgi:hypothetical protein
MEQAAPGVFHGILRSAREHRNLIRVGAQGPDHGALRVRVRTEHSVRIMVLAGEEPV